MATNSNKLISITATKLEQTKRHQAKTKFSIGRQLCRERKERARRKTQRRKWFIVWPVAFTRTNHTNIQVT